MLKRARDVVAQGVTSSVVDYAIEVHRLVKQASTELEEAKVWIRAHARKVASGLDRVELEGNLGSALVVIPDDTVKVRKDQDLRDIEANLSPETFARLFTKEVVVKPAKDLKDQIKSLAPAERRILDRFLEVVETTAKVNLPG